MSFQPALIMRVLSVLLDSVAAWFYCCVMAVFIVPLICDRLFFFLPKLLRFARNGETYYRGVVFSVWDVILWSAIMAGAYLYLYFFQPPLFQLTTLAPPAIAAWIVGIVHAIYRTVHFDKIVKKDFYYSAYMRYIKPETLRKYQQFLQNLDDMKIGELEELLENEKSLSYMYLQAVQRKKREIVGYTQGAKPLQGKPQLGNAASGKPI